MSEDGLKFDQFYVLKTIESGSPYRLPLSVSKRSLNLLQIDPIGPGGPHWMTTVELEHIFRRNWRPVPMGDVDDRVLQKFRELKADPGISDYIKMLRDQHEGDTKLSEVRDEDMVQELRRRGYRVSSIAEGQG